MLLEILEPRLYDDLIFFFNFLIWKKILNLNLKL